MAEYKALNPNVEVNGSAILATVAGLGSEVMDLLKQHGIEQLDAESWYPQQVWLDTLKAINDREGGGMMNLVSIGMRIPDNAMWPPEIRTIEAALQSIDVAYHMNHRGGEIGSYRTDLIAPGHIRFDCDNPYPSDFDYGIIYRTAQKFRAQNVHFKVVRAVSPSRLNGDDRCIYDVTWN